MNPDEEWKRAGLVLDHFNQLEGLMKDVIEAYVRPVETRAIFFRAYLLNNAIVPLAGKIKLIFAINNELSLVSLDRNRLHRLLAIRNAFAHNDVLSGFDVHIPENLESPITEHVYMESIKGDGSIERLTRDRATGEFFTLHQYVKTALEEMVAKLRA